MIQRRLKFSLFLLEACNSFATSLYFFYLFFFMAKQYGFENRHNLALAALNGFVYMNVAWLGGRFGQRLGYFNALTLGFSLMAVALTVGGLLNNLAGHILAMVTCTIGMCFTWPNFQALISEKESPSGLPKMLGIYNMVWAGVGGLAFFSGGALLETLGLRGLFWVPVGIFLCQLAFLAWLKEKANTVETAASSSDLPSAPLPPLNPRPIARAKIFLRMAWFANPFAYIAINTVVAVTPGIARELHLTPKLAGFFCSIWFFARLGIFTVLWRWNGWHYRFRWFLGAYLLLIAGFATVLLSGSLPVVMIAQIAFGMGIGLIYYSSLFYSMNVGEAKGEHGGFHESAIGAGIFGGPAIAWAALHFFPNRPNSGTLAVTTALVLGLAGLLAMRHRSRGRF